jgi:ribonuclease HI
MVELFTDGGARGNPGPAAIGGLALESGKLLFDFSESIGETTNNQAEYQALIWGLHELKKLGVGDVTCFLDSELVVCQLQGRYKVKNAGLQPLYQEAASLISSFPKLDLQHIPRSRNHRADLLVNKALDQAS